MSITTRAPYGFELEYMPIDAFGGAGPHKLNPIAYSLMHKQPTLHGGGGGNVFKAVIAVAAAVAVPYFAPAIASSIGLSGAVSTALAGTFAAGASGAIAGGIVGAALGAVAAKVTGQDAGRGALFGAIGGGISGYQGINSATGALNAPAGAASTTGAGAQAPVSATSGFTPSYNVETGLYDVVDKSTGLAVQGGLDAQGAAQTASDLGAQLSGSSGPAYRMGTQTFDDGSSIQTLGDGSTIVTNTEGQIVSTTPSVAGAEGAGLNTATAPTTPAAPTAPSQTGGAQTPAAGPQTAGSSGTLTERFVEGAKKVGSEIVKSATDPKKQADFLLRAAGQIAGTYAAPDGMSDEEKQLLNQQRQELETLRTTNQELFKEKLDAARSLVQGANYFDPEYFGLQRARQVQQTGARVEREALSKIPQARAGLRESEQRRIRLSTGRDVGTAYDTGFLGAVDAQNRALSAGLNLYPSASSLSTMGYAQNLQNMYNTADERKRRSIKETQGLFGTALG